MEIISEAKLSPKKDNRAGCCQIAGFVFIPWSAPEE
jgi:hypothetical protein